MSKLVAGLYYTLKAKNETNCVAYFYNNPDFHMNPNGVVEAGKDYSELGFGFNTADGGGFLPAFDITDKTDISMTFGQALEAMKQGCKVARSGWDGRGMWLILVAGSNGIRPVAGTPYSNAGITDKVNINPHIDMFTASGDMQPGWLASQTDMLADDWRVID